MSNLFTISIGGRIGTINGLRLGTRLGEKVPIPTPPFSVIGFACVVCCRLSLYSLCSLYICLISLFIAFAFSDVANKVGWKELNEAFGQVALLLHVLAKAFKCKYQRCDKFPFSLPTIDWFV